MMPILGVAIIFSLLSPCFTFAGDQWPMYQANPSHTGFIPVSVDPTKFALRWQVQIGSLPLNPVTAAGGGHVFVSKIGYFDFNGPSLYALDSGSGASIWSKDFGNVFSVNPPSYSNGTVYIQTGQDTAGSAAPYLHAYDAATGTLLFRSEFGAQWENYYAPTIYQGKVYIDGGEFGGMYSFDGSTGYQDWFYTGLPQYDQWTPAVDANWAYAYMGYNSDGGGGSGLYVLDRLTGQLVFQIPDPTFNFDGGSMNLAPVLGGLSDLFVINSSRLIRFDLNARGMGWVNTANFSGQPAVANGTVYAINAGALGAYDQTTGTSQWMWEAPDGDTLQDTVIATNSHLFVGSASNTYCIDLTSHEEVWSYPSAGYLSLGESTLYIAGSDGTLTAIGMGIPDIYVPELTSFDHVDLGEAVTQTMSISNVGDAPLQVQSIVSSSGEFTVQSPPLPRTIAPHQSVPISVTYTPAAAGTGRGNLLIDSNDPNDPEISVVLSVIHNISATAGNGGQISPSGSISVLDGYSASFTIAPKPNYQLTTLVVDGVDVENPSTSPLSYAFSNVESDHTITAVFAPYFDYFGMQDGNSFESLATYPGGSTQTQTDNISLDTTTFSQPSYVDLSDLGTTSGQTWYQVLSSGLFMNQMQSSVYTFTFTQALPMIKTPLAAKAHWTASTTFSEEGIPSTAKITATVSPMVLVSVPAGHFLAWPIMCNLSLSARGRTTSKAFTTWFAPYIGTVMTKVVSPAETDQLTSFAVGGGTVTTPPPVVTGTFPKSATVGAQISINGFQFGTSQGTSVVRIGSVDCDQIVSWSDTQIECTVPGTASSGAVTVITDTWTSNDTVNFTIPPQITSVTPSRGTRGSAVQIQGSNFGTVQGKVKLGASLTKISQWGNNSITCTVPAGMPCGEYPVTVINSQGQSVLKGAFTVVK